MEANILLVEDDHNLGLIVKDSLEIHGYHVEMCKNGEEAWDSFSKNHYDICLLDVMMPRMDGLQLSQTIRTVNEQVPVLFLTAKSLKEDRIAGFLSGGDDYITKPFHIDELLHRIKVFLKRSKTVNDQEEKILLGKAEFYPKKLQIKLPSGLINLTQKEAAILCLLYKHQPSVVERKTLLMSIWGDDDYFMGRSLDVFISKLRKHLKDLPEISIRNVHGLGFCLEID